jgi:predicted dehydrogenase
LTFNIDFSQGVLIMDKIRIGVIGMGNMGSSHIKALLAGEIPEAELAAAADRRPSCREQWAKSLPAGLPVFTDGSDLIKSGKVDAVVLAVPHYQHPTLAIEAFAAGLHVMSEKPAGVYTKQVREMNAAAEKSGKVFGVMFNQRTNTWYQKMREIVKSGSMGAIKRVNWIVTNWYRTQTYYDSGEWRATWDGEGGGVLLNQCPHNLDLLQWICGVPSVVRAYCHNGKWHDIEVEDDVSAYLEFPNGATGNFITSTGDAPGTNRFEITLEKGKLVADNGTLLTIYELDQNERDYCKTATDPFGQPKCTITKIETGTQEKGHIKVMIAFVGNILHGTPLVAEGKEGINGVTIANAMHLSSWLGKEITVPFDEDLFLAELNKRRASSKAKKDTGKVFDTKNTY